MTTRTEEIAGEEYPTVPSENISARNFNYDQAQRRLDFIKGYKRGQQDRWIPIAEWKEPLAGTLVVRLSDGGYPEVRAWKAMGHDHIPKWITHFMILPSPPNPEQR